MGKFYCKECQKIINRFQVQAMDSYYDIEYYCKYCHNKTERVERMLVRLDQSLSSRKHQGQLNGFKDWIRREAIERYPNNPGKKKAFKEGMYALLDHIGFDYGKKEE